MTLYPDGGWLARECERVRMSFLCRRCHVQCAAEYATSTATLPGPFCGESCLAAAADERLRMLAAEAVAGRSSGDRRNHDLPATNDGDPVDVVNEPGKWVLRDGDEVWVNEKGITFVAPPAGGAVLARARINMDPNGSAFVPTDFWGAPDHTPNLTALHLAVADVLYDFAGVYATAYRFWRTDPDVIAAVEEIADHVAGGRVSHGRLGRAYVLAWRNDYLGLRSRWVQRAYRAESSHGIPPSPSESR